LSITTSNPTPQGRNNTMYKRILPAILIALGLLPMHALAQDEPVAPEDVFTWVGAREKPEMVKAAFLGVTGERVSPAMNSQLKLPKGLGLVVTHVVPDGPAAEAGVQKHDVLHKLDDQLLVNFEQFAVLLRLHKPGETVTLSIIRGGEPMTITATLTEREVPELSSTDPMFNHAPRGLWINPGQSAPFNTLTIPTPPKIDHEKLNAEILRALPKRFLKQDDENVIYTKDRYQMRIVDGEHKITVNKLTEDGPIITVEDAQGHVLHEGKWDPKHDYSSELPKDVIDKVRNVLEARPVGEPIRIRADEIEITNAPEPPAAPNAPATPAESENGM
jgi:hypothetical protein